MEKRIVVTGGKGFLGKYVVKRLKEKGNENIFITTKDKYDLRDINDIKKMYSRLKPDIIIHLAAVVGGIGANKKNPGVFFYDNLIMSIQLMEQARLNSIDKFVAIGTVCAYPKYTKVPFKEEDLWNGYPEETNAPYGLAKKMLLVQSKVYREQYDFNSIYLIPTNLYGPGDNFNPDSSHVIPALIKKFHDAKINGASEVSVWGTGKATREFLYVEDCAEAIIMALEKYNRGEPINIGSGREISIRELVQKIREIINFEGKVIWDKTKSDGQPRRCIDTSKAKKEFGFVARTDLEYGLEKTVRWYLNNKKKLCS